MSTRKESYAHLAHKIHLQIIPFSCRDFNLVFSLLAWWMYILCHSRPDLPPRCLRIRRTEHSILYKQVRFVGCALRTSLKTLILPFGGSISQHVLKATEA